VAANLYRDGTPCSNNIIIPEERGSRFRRNIDTFLTVYVTSELK